MSITVTIPGSLNEWLNGKDQAVCQGKTIGDCVSHLDGNFSGFKDRVLKDDGEIKDFVMIFLNGDNIRNLQGLQTPLKDTDEISIIPFMAGG